jgi:hypothetical protein
MVTVYTVRGVDDLNHYGARLIEAECASCAAEIYMGDCTSECNAVLDTYEVQVLVGTCWQTFILIGEAVWTARRES